MTEGISRRTFFGAAAAASVAPGDRVRLGFIASGGRARALMQIFAENPDVDIPVICDPIEPRMQQALKALAGLPRPQKPECVIDYRRVLDRKDVDAVVIASTQQWHGIPHIHACQAGKHIYVEKPLSHTVVEGRAMVNAAKKHGVIALMGTQQRCGDHYKKAVEIIQSGRLGKIGLVESWNCSNSVTRVGRPPDSDPPPGYHWDLWLGPAPKVPFNPARLAHAWWFDYSGGMLTNWAVHHMDIILWAMRASHPTSVVSTGGKKVVNDLADTYDTIETAWEFPGFVVTYRYRGYSNFRPVQSRPGYLGHGICFYGSQATMVLDRAGWEIWAEPKPDKPVETMEGGRYYGGKTEQDGPYQRTFLDCVKQNRPAEIALEDSHRATVSCHLGNIAYLTKRRLEWDGERESIRGDAESSRLLDRPRRKGYELPKV